MKIGCWLPKIPAVFSMRELVIDGIALDKEGRYPILVLRDLVTPRYVTLRIGPSEALAILISLKGDSPPRPLTHDLMKALIEAVGSKLERVELTEVKDGVCYAKLVLRLPDGGVRKVDSRPSDSVALALRMGSPLYIDDALFEELSQELPDV